MATHLDLQEQEQLDSLKHLWKQYGNLVTWVLVLALSGFAAFNFWQKMQRDRALQASALYDQVDLAVQAGDAAKAARAFDDLKDRYGSTAFAEQGGVLLAKLQFDKGEFDAARASLDWVAAKATEKEYQWIAKLRLAGLLLDQKKYDEALAALPADASKPFGALADDRRGDILLAQGKQDAARAAYRAAWDAMEPGLDYRRLIDAKLTALGAAPEAGASAAAAATAASAPAAAAASAPTAGASR